MGGSITCVWIFLTHFLGYYEHYNDVIMSAMASRFTDVSIVCSNFCSREDQRKHQSLASLAFVSRFHRWPVDSPRKRLVTRKMFPFDGVIMKSSASDKSYRFADPFFVLAVIFEILESTKDVSPSLYLKYFQNPFLITYKTGNNRIRLPKYSNMIIQMPKCFLMFIRYWVPSAWSALREEH